MPGVDSRIAVLASGSGTNLQALLDDREVGPCVRLVVSDVPDAFALEHLPNVGPTVAGYLRRAGVNRPGDLVGRDPYAVFAEVCRVTGQRLDPCLLDTIIAAVRFMGGEEAKPWWAYTAERKRELDARRREADRE